jgi:hypothetical protein
VDKEGYVATRWKLILWIAGTIILAIGAVCVIGSVLISRHARDWVQTALSEQYNSKVELSKFDIAIPFPLVQATGEGLVLHFEDNADLPPLIAVSRFTVRTSFWGLLRKNIHFVRLEGLQINIPPRSAADSGRRNGAKNIVGKMRSVRFGEIVSENAVLKVLTTKPGKDPLTFDIEHLNLSSTTTAGQLAFRATLTNPKPPGQIFSTGTFGPWDPDTPSLTPVSGVYTFDHADLGIFRGIQGTLSSKGEYRGVLEQIQAEGTTDTPDFQVSRAGHTIDLSTEYHATVDGTDGDTYLHPVEVRFLNTTLLCDGSVEGRAGEKGKTITLNVSADHARIEDLLKLAVKEEAPMSGPTRLKTKFVLSPGPEEIFERVNLDGSFSLDSAHFTNPTVQQKVDNVSKRSLGKPSEIVPPEKAIETDDVATELNGQFRIEHATLTLTAVEFQIPGAKVQLHGTYTLNDENLDLHGSFAMQAKLSQTVTGVKSLLLRPLNHFFSKHGSGTYLPIKITGPMEHPKYGPDFGHKETAEKAQR